MEWGVVEWGILVLAAGGAGVALASLALGFLQIAVARTRETASVTEAPVARTRVAPPPLARPAPKPGVVPAPTPKPEPVVPPMAPAKPEPVVPPMAPAKPEPVVPPTAPPVSLRAGLSKTRAAFVGRLDALLRGAPALDPATLDEIEALLFSADLGVRTAEGLLEAARGADGPGAVRAAIELRALEILRSVERPPPGRTHDGPHVVLVVGVNGSGKTTTIGKLASRWKRDGEMVVVAAADTFRAAATEQLEIWSQRAGVEIVKGKPGSDPAAVAFDGVQTALRLQADALLVDTAGRLQTDRGLMDELAKIKRVVQKELPDAPHEVLLVLDANTGQNAIRQAREFGRVVEVSGIVLTKLDGTAKGGVALGIAEEIGLPVSHIGIGESVDDLRPFDAEDFVQALFAPGDV